MNEELKGAIERVEELCSTQLLPESCRKDFTLVLKAAKTKIGKSKAPGAPRPRNLELDALAEISGFKLNEVTQGMWGRLSKALKEIQAVMPDVTSEEIRRRARLYKQMWPQRDLTGTALAAWWGAIGKVRPATQGSSSIGENLR